MQFSLFEVVSQKNVKPYRLTLRWMHGDADLYEEEVEEYETEQELYDAHQWMVVTSRAKNTGNHSEAAAILGVPEDEIDLFFSERWPRDVAYGDSNTERAKLDRITLSAIVDNTEYQLRLPKTE